MTDDKMERCGAAAMIEDEARVAFAAYSGLGRRIIDDMIAEIISLRASLAYCERLASQRAGSDPSKKTAEKGGLV